MLARRDEVVGVIPPPPGTTANFVDPPTRAHIVIVVNIVCSVLSVLFVGLRSYTAIRITRHVRTDDYMLIVAWVLALLFSIVDCTNSKYGLGRHLWDVPISTFNPAFMKTGIVSGVFYGFSMMLTKLSILMLFRRFVLQGKLRSTIHVIMAVVVLYILVASFDWVYTCQPMDKYWDLTVTGGRCINWVKISVFGSVMNAATDVAILILPVVILRDSRLPQRQKIGVMIVLMTGGFILIVSIIKARLTVGLVDKSDVTWDIVSPTVWWAIEVHLAIVCACLPAGKPFLRKHLPKILNGRSTRDERLSSKDRGGDPQDIILAEREQNGSCCVNASTTIVDLKAEQPASTEYSSDKGLIIVGSREVEYSSS